MTSLIYTPGVSIVIDTAKDGLVDISDDLVNGGVTLRENGSHSFDATMNNTFRKYDGVFTPNDRVVIQLKRLTWLQVFAGYLDDVPHYSTYPRPVSISGQCTLKVMKNWPWDAHTEIAHNILSSRTQADRQAQDGGISAVAVNVMKEVVGWDPERIHIGKVPDQWFDKFRSVYQAIAQDVQSAYDVLGTNPIIAGKVSAASTPSDPNLDLAVGSTDMDTILLTIRTLESGGNYKAVNKGDGSGDWATGAYQFIDSSWGNYSGYPRAFLAPPSVQDAKAREYVNYIIGRYGNKVVNVPYGWYYPKVFTDPSLLDKVPAANEHNTLTIRQYGEKWLQTYREIYRRTRGTEPSLELPSTYSSRAGSVAAANPTDAIYPIPAGVQKLDYQKAAWGGYSNGQVPPSAMKYNKPVGYGHPAAINAHALMFEEAAKAGYDLSGSCYRSIEQQRVGAAQSGLFAKPGHSIHGWGLAIDFTVLTGASKKYGSYSFDQMCETPEYLWLAANAWRWGFGHPSWAQKGGSKPEPWHWEFLAFENFRNSPEARPGSGFNPSSQGANPFDGTSLPSLMPNAETSQLYSTIAFWEYADTETDAELETAALTGYKAPMNDTPVLETVQQLLTTANRSYCAAPNGDFISWFPDYWGEYGTAGRLNVELIELQDFTVRFSDASLITHMYVEGSMALNGSQTNVGPLPSGLRDAANAVLTAGVATVEIPRFLESIVNHGSDQFPWLNDPEALLRRFGARIDRRFIGTIYGPQQEFWYAVSLFVRAWAEMFQASIPLTFMPELFPGMLLCVPDLKVQFYVKSVTHRWDFANDAGFSTSAETVAPSATDGSGFFLFPKGGLQPEKSTLQRGLFLS